MSDIKLVVQADDFGMCHAVNQAVVRAFHEGILTQAVMMVPCSAFEEAAELARRDSIPVGLHCTLTAEWDHLRWAPLSGGASLREADGGFHRTIERATAEVDVHEAKAELVMQAQRMVDCGLDTLYIDTHMGMICPEAYEHVCEQFDLPFLWPTVVNHIEFTSFGVLSPRHAAIKRSWLMDFLSDLGPGNHFLQTHPGVAGEELRGLTPRDAPNADWTEEFRASDLAMLTSPAVAAHVEQLGIKLVTVADFVSERPATASSAAP